MVIPDLIATLEGLTSPRREVDEAMRIHFKYPPKPWNYTASLDATVALCERVLPGWTWGGRNNGEYLPEASLVEFGFPFDEDAGRPIQAETPAIALLIAILTAKEARKNG